MGYFSRSTVIVLLLSTVSSFAADLNSVRNEMNNLERDLLSSKQTQVSASSQLKKIRRLLVLQKKEIELSQKKIDELGESMKDLDAQKQALLAKIDRQKMALRRKLRELNEFTEVNALDASWLRNLDADNQKTYFLSKTLKKDLKRVDDLKIDVKQAVALELRILEEKNKLDYYVHELQGEAGLLGANETIQKEIIRTNRASRLEGLQHLRSLKESEHALEKTILRVKPEALQEALLAGGIDLSFASMRGKLPFPTDGPVLSSFGKSYSPQTKLLTFQKGITVGSNLNAPVKAVSNGKVVFVGPLKNYGLIVILEHPGQYYSLYGQMGALSVDMGAAVKQGDVVGRTAGQPLYFEIRNKNVAVNPMQWLTNGAIALSKQ